MCLIYLLNIELIINNSQLLKNISILIIGTIIELIFKKNYTLSTLVCITIIKLSKI